MTGMIIGSSSPSGTTTGTGNGTTTGTSTGNGSSSADATKVAWNSDEQAIVQAALVDKKAPHHAISKMQDGSPSQGLFEESSPINQTNLGIGGRMASRGTKKRGGRGRKPPTTAMNTVPNANLDAVLAVAVDIAAVFIVAALAVAAVAAVHQPAAVVASLAVAPVSAALAAAALAV